MMKYVGGIERITVSDVVTDGELGLIDSGEGIDYQALTSLPEADDELRHYVSMLQNVKVFESEMAKLPEQGPPGIRRGTSRHMSRHQEKLLKWKVVRETRHVRAITNFFTVAKKNGTLRLVVDARKINNLMRRIPKMDLPTVQEVLMLLMGSKYYITVDGTSYFYQWHIAPEVGEFFCANLAGARGTFTTVALTRMPMGWSWAPAIAQKGSNTLLSDRGTSLGVAWIDNFIFGGSSKDSTLEKFRRFRDRCDICRVKIDDRDPPVLERGEVLGLEVDLENKRFRMAASWVEKARALRITSFMTPRELYRITGNCIWACTARQTPLCFFSDQIEVVRRIALLVAAGLAWDTPVRLSRDEMHALGVWKARVEENEWSTVTEKAPPVLEMWTDSSSHMWAFTDLGWRVGQGSFTEEQFNKWHIFVKEAYAVQRSMAVSRGIPRVYKVDNMPLVLAMKRQVSSNKMVNTWMSNWDWENISVEWVSTHQQEADEYTRGKLFTF